MNDRSRRRLTLIVLTASLTMVQIDQTIVAVALPTIEAELGLSFAGGQWIVNAYLLAMTALVLPGGRLADAVGHRRALLGGLLLFAGASVLCGAAQSSGWIFAARALQGAAAAVMMPATQALVTGNAERGRAGRAFGVYIGIAGVGLAVGPMLGGAIAEHLGWRWIFFVNPLIAVPMWLVARSVVRSDPAGRRPSLAGAPAALVVAGIGALGLGLAQGEDWGWTSAGVLVAFAVAVLAIVAFLAADRRSSDPLLDVALLRVASVRAGAWLIFVIRLPTIWGTVMLAAYLQKVLGYAPLEAGIAMLPLTLAYLVGAVVAGRAQDALGWQTPTLAGFALVIAGLVVLGLVADQVAWWPLVVPMVALGLGLNLATTPVNAAAMQDVGESSRAGVSGILGVGRQLGGSLGSVVLGAIVASRISSEGLARGIETGAYVAAALLVVGLLLGARDLRAPRRGAPAGAAPPA